MIRQVGAVARNINGCSTIFDFDLHDQAWKKDALCAQVDPELFFPDQGASPRAAKKVCAGCPVREECLEEGITSLVLHGIWGGVTARDLRVLRRERQQAQEPDDEQECA